MRPLSIGHVLASALFVSFTLASSGCSQLAGKQLENDHAAFNTAVADAMDRQMLLNLVRLAHDEPTQWVSVTQINTSTTYRAAVGTSANFQGLAFEGASADAGFSYTPTLTFVPRQGEQLANEMMAPIPVESMEHLVSAGYPMSWILFLACERFQSVQSFDVNVRDGIVSADSKFARAIILFSDLQRRGLISLSLVRVPVIWNWEPIPKESVTLASIMSARTDNSVLELREDGKGYDFVSIERVPVLTAYDGIQSDANGRELCEILGIEPIARDWKLVGIEDRIPGEFLTVRTRSLSAVLRLLSLGVDRRDNTMPAPPRAANASAAFASLESGMTSERLRELVRSVFVIERSASAPSDAAVSVLHAGQWYFIREDDRTTKQAFAMLRDLFDLQVKPERTNGRPVLTVPIR
jgi:hypothetical protein